MPTLNDLRKAAGYKTIKAFAEATNLTPSIASQWLNGARSDVNEMPLLPHLGINREQYLEAYRESREVAEARWREKHPPRPPEEVEAEFKASAEAIYAKMSDADKRQVHEFAAKHLKRRSPLDIMIDRACGLE